MENSNVINNNTNFEITDIEIGKGGFGKVFVAYEKNNKNKKYAAKQLDFDQIRKKIKNNNNEIESLNNEVSILLEYNNENLVHCYGLIPGNNELYIITEYCNGKDLNFIINKWMEKTNTNYFPENIIQKILKDVLNGLSSLHRDPTVIIHHDIKLQNILVNFENETDLNNLDLVKATYKIADFGLSKYHPNEDSQINIGGTSSYWSPEIRKFIVDNNKYKIQSDIDINDIENQAVDIWAIGVLAYRLLNFNKILFSEGNLSGNSIDDSVIFYNNMKKGKIYFNLKEKKISKEFICFLDAALKFDANDRATSEDLEYFRFISRPENEFHYITTSNYKQTLDFEYCDNDYNVIIDINKKNKLNGINCFDE